MKTLSRTLSYRRAVFDKPNDHQNGSVQKYISSAHSKFTKIVDRRITTESGSLLECIKSRHDNGRLRLHIVEYAPNQDTSGVPKAKNSTEQSELSEISSPEGYDFLGGDMKVLIRKNEILICRNNMHENNLRTYLHGMLEKSYSYVKNRQFSIRRPANKNMLKLIKKVGVKKIDFGVSAYVATLDSINQDNLSGLFGKGIFDQIKKTLLNKDSSFSEIEGKENIHTKISIYWDGNGKKDLGLDRVQQIGEHMASTEPGSISIIANDGTKITGNQLTLRRSVDLRQTGNTVDPASTFRALTEYFEYLEENGYTET